MVFFPAAALDNLLAGFKVSLMAHSLWMQPLGHHGEGAKTEWDVSASGYQERLSGGLRGEREGSGRTDVQGH